MNMEIEWAMALDVRRQEVRVPENFSPLTGVVGKR